MSVRAQSLFVTNLDASDLAMGWDGMGWERGGGWYIGGSREGGRGISVLPYFSYPTPPISYFSQPPGPAPRSSTTLLPPPPPPLLLLSRPPRVSFYTSAEQGTDTSLPSASLRFLAPRSLLLATDDLSIQTTPPLLIYTVQTPSE